MSSPHRRKFYCPVAGCRLTIRPSRPLTRRLNSGVGCHLKIFRALLACSAILCGCASFPHDAALARLDVVAIRVATKNSCSPLTYIGACRGDFHVDSGGTCALGYTRGTSFTDPAADFHLFSVLNGVVTSLGHFARTISATNEVEFIQFASSDGRRCRTQLINQADR